MRGVTPFERGLSGKSGRTEARNALNDPLASLERDGYAVVRDVVSEADMARARANSFFRESAVAEMPASAILADDCLAGVIFGDAVVEVYRRLFTGTAVLFPNVSVRRNVYTPWHVDRGFVGKGAYIRRPDFRAYQFGVYLTAGPDGAPALDVRPRSHRLLQRCPFRTTALIDIYSYGLSTRYRPVTLEVGPGDLLVWDCRVFHRGTPVGAGSPNTEKLALYWSMSIEHPEHEDGFMRHLVGRGHRPRGLDRFARQANPHRYRELESLDPLAALHRSLRGRADELAAAGILRMKGSASA